MNFTNQLQMNFRLHDFQQSLNKSIAFTSFPPLYFQAVKEITCTLLILSNTIIYSIRSNLIQQIQTFSSHSVVINSHFCCKSPPNEAFYHFSLYYIQC